MERTLNPDVAPRMRGVVEKCSFCHARYHAAQSKAAANETDAIEYVPACAEACPTGAIQFGDLADPSSEVARTVRSPNAFRLLEGLRTDTSVYYTSERKWVRDMAVSGMPGRSEAHG
jgi:molybdopterin-containing oxidoreductase family iron-sulfur binding subunit